MVEISVRDSPGRGLAAGDGGGAGAAGAQNQVPATDYCSSSCLPLRYVIDSASRRGPASVIARGVKLIP
jgi:hypothetical protein